MKLTASSVTEGLDLHHYKYWDLVDERITTLVREGSIRRIPALSMLHVRSEEWYLEPISGDVYVYVRPDDKIVPQWEKIDVFAPPPEQESKDLRKVGLKIIRTGNISNELAMFIKHVLGVMIQEGKVEIISGRNPSTQKSSKGIETCYREITSDEIYRLIEDPEFLGFFWEKLPSTPM
jgi:hypothetical protein